MTPPLRVERRRTQLLVQRLFALQKRVEEPAEIALELDSLRDAPPSPGLAEWSARFGWTPVELDVFATVLCLHVFPELGQRVSELMGQLSRTTPSIGIVATLLDRLHQAHEVQLALTAGAPLVDFGFLDVHDPDEPLTDRRVAADAFVVQSFFKSRVWPAALTPVAFRLTRAADVVPALPEAIESRLKDLARTDSDVRVVIDGVPGSGRKRLARKLARRPLLVVDFARLRDQPEPQVMRALRHALREAWLHGDLLYFDVPDTTVSPAPGGGEEAPHQVPAASPTARVHAMLVDLLDRLPGPCVIGASLNDPRAWSWSGRPTTRLSVPPPDLALQAQAWARQSGKQGLGPVDAEALARRFPLELRGIGTVLERAGDRVRGGSPTSVGLIEAEARERLRVETGRIAETVSTGLSTQDLVLPGDLREQVAEIVNQVRHRDTVLDRYGLRRWGGPGLHVLLSGEPGTGKTTLAMVLGRALGREVLRVNLDQVFSKYIGETEKHLVQVFALAERSHALLLLDEADALLGERTDVKQATDRFANLAVNLVLQLMDQFSVLSVATTNRLQSLDSASIRRFAFRLQFPLPDVDAREELFRRMAPLGVRLDPEIDWRWLAEKVDLSGGYIRNIMQRAAAFAAENGDVLTADIMTAAVNRELTQLGRLVQARKE